MSGINNVFGTGPEVDEADAPKGDGTTVRDANGVRWSRKNARWYPSAVRLEPRTWVRLNKDFGPVVLQPITKISGK